MKATEAPSGVAPGSTEAAHRRGGEAAVEFADVSFAYAEGALVLRGVTFRILEGSSVCIIGPNGGGKTTLLKLLLGLLKPDRGEIRVFGEAPARARLGIGYMPQYLSFDPRFPITVLDVVLMGRIDRCRFGRFRSEDREAARHALGEVGLDAVADRAFASLSGGQRQRVLIARALACEPRMLLLDEPTANIDQTVEERFFETLADLRRRMTIVMVSHDLGVVSSMADTVVCVNRDVHLHPTSALTGRSIEEIYGMSAVAVHHRHGECHDHHDHAAPEDPA